MKMYLDDSLQNPVVHSSSFISTHLEKPSLGGITGTSSFPSYGSFLEALMNCEFMIVD